MRVAFLDVKTHDKLLKKKYLSALSGIIDKGNFILGEEVNLFEKDFAAYCGSKFCVGVNSGTDALFLSLLSLGIGPGDEVICPVYTYIATALSISYTGAKPVFVDIERKSLNLDPEKVAEKITAKTRAIIAVHLYGRPADMSAVNRIAGKYGLRVVEDAAQAHGAEIIGARGQGRKVGTFSDAGCFSFYPTKNLGGFGDGGCVVTDNKKIFEKMLMLRDQGRKAGKNRYRHFILGYNSRLDAFQAALLREKLKYLDSANRIRREIAGYYSASLRDISGLELIADEEKLKNVYHIYPLLIKKRRDRIHAGLSAAGIGSAVVYHLPLHLQNAYADLKYRRGDFPEAETAAKQILCLPMHGNLTKKETVMVVENIKKLLG